MIYGVHYVSNLSRRFDISVKNNFKILNQFHDSKIQLKYTLLYFDG